MENTTSPNQPVEKVAASELITATPEPAAHVVRGTPSVASSQSTDTGTPGVPPSPAKPAAPGPAPSPGKPPASVRVDSAGVPFDPAKHLDKPHGKTGRWMPKRPKRIGNLNGEIGTAGPTIGDENAAGSPAGVEPAAAVASGPDEYVIAAQSACAILYALGMTIGGDEWKPSDDEHTNLATAFEGYFRAKGLSDIPPGWALTIAVGVYVGPRMRKPKTLSTLQKIGAGVRGLFAWFKRGRIAAAIPEVARRDQPQPVSDNGRR